MPWYVWLIIVLALGSVVSGLLLLRGSAKKLPLTEPQLKHIRERNAELDMQETKNR